jgi:hypothetical protein
VSPDELVAVGTGIAEIGTPASHVGKLLALVRDHRLAQRTRLPDTGSVVAVARELG